MDQMDFNKLVKAIRSSYGRDKVLADAETVEFWYSMLKDLPYKQVASNLEHHIRASQFPPTIAELRQETQEEIAETETWVEEWGKVRYAMQYIGVYKPKEALDSFDNPITLKVVKALGWHNLCDSTNSDMDRAHFRDAYNVEQQRAAAIRSLAPDVREKLESEQWPKTLEDKS